MAFLDESFCTSKMTKQLFVKEDSHPKQSYIILVQFDTTLDVDLNVSYVCVCVKTPRNTVK